MGDASCGIAQYRLLPLLRTAETPAWLLYDLPIPSVLLMKSWGCEYELVRARWPLSPVRKLTLVGVMPLDWDWDGLGLMSGVVAALP